MFYYIWNLKPWKINSAGEEHLKGSEFKYFEIRKMNSIQSAVSIQLSLLFSTFVLYKNKKTKVYYYYYS